VPMKIGLADGVDQRARGVDHPTQCDQPHGLYIGLDELWNPNHGNPNPSERRTAWRCVRTC
jgi:hypothetical protein